MALTIKIKRATRAQLDSAASASELIQGEPYLITDENKIAVGLSATTYEVFAKDSALGASKALDNLASVAINESLILATDEAKDLGSTTKKWLNLFVKTIGATATRITKGWFTDLEVTNLPSINGGTLAAALNTPMKVVAFGTTITDTADITAANHKLKTTDVNKSTAVTLTLKKNGFAVGEWVVLVQTGDGQFTLNGEAGVTVPAWKKSAGKGFEMYVYCVDATTDANIFRTVGGVE